MIELPSNYKFKEHLKNHLRKRFDIKLLLELAGLIGVLLTVLYSADFSELYSDSKIATIALCFTLGWLLLRFFSFVLLELNRYLGAIEDFCIEKENTLSVLDNMVNDLSKNDIGVVVERISDYSKPTIVLNERMGIQIGQLLSLRVVVREVDYLIGLISVKRISHEGKALCELDYLNVDSGLAEIIDNPLSEQNIIARVVISSDDLNQLKEVSQNDR